MKDKRKFAKETNLEKTSQKEGISYAQKGTEAGTVWVCSEKIT